MFARREVFKEYLAVARPIPDSQARAAALSGELTVRTRIEKIRGELQVRQWDQPSYERELLSPNATTGVRILTVFDAPGAHHTADTPQHTGAIAHPAPGCPITGGQLALYRLRPHTGKTHQLRAHLHLLGAPIAGDVLYPKVLPPADAPELPLQLVAHRLEFEHPVTGERVRLRSMRKLALLPS
jgi:pseudouridylate synthase